MKKTIRRLTGLTLMAALILTTATLPANATPQKEDVMSDEVVYVFADESGNVNKVMDSVWIEEGEEKEVSAKEAGLPVSLKLTYTLDGKQVKPEDLSGKSGHLIIKCEAKSLKYETRTINNEETKIYVPFMVAGISILDGEHAKNVTVSQGKSVYDGARYAVAGVSFAGLKDDLSLKDFSMENGDKETSEKLKDTFSDAFTIEADVTDYEDNGMYVIVSNDIFNAIDVTSFTGEDSVKEALDKLNEGMDELCNGSEKLTDGIDKLYNGTVKLQSAMGELSDGLGQITDNNEALVQGAYDTFNAILATANKEIAAAGLDVPALTISNYGDVIDGAIATLGGTDVYGKVKAGVDEKVKANEATIRAGVTAKVEEGVTAKVKPLFDAGINQKYGHSAEELIALGMLTQDQYDAMLKAEVDKQMGSDEVKALIDQNTEQQINLIAQEKMNSKEVQDIINSSNAQVNEGVAKLSALKGQLDSYNQFYNGIIEYTSAVKKASDGAGMISAQLPELVDGAKQLKEGSVKLHDGLISYDEEGIGKLTAFIEDNTEGLLDRLTAISEVSKGYEAYSADNKNAKDGVKFVYKLN